MAPHTAWGYKTIASQQSPVKAFESCMALKAKNYSFESKIRLIVTISVYFIGFFKTHVLPFCNDHITETQSPIFIRYVEVVSFSVIQFFFFFTF